MVPSIEGSVRNAILRARRQQKRRARGGHRTPQRPPLQLIELGTVLMGHDRKDIKRACIGDDGCEVISDKFVKFVNHDPPSSRLAGFVAEERLGDELGHDYVSDVDAKSSRQGQPEINQHHESSVEPFPESQR